MIYISFKHKIFSQSEVKLDLIVVPTKLYKTLDHPTWAASDRCILSIIICGFCHDIGYEAGQDNWFNDNPSCSVEESETTKR